MPSGGGGKGVRGPSIFDLKDPVHLKHPWAPWSCLGIRNLGTNSCSTLETLRNRTAGRLSIARHFFVIQPSCCVRCLLLATDAKSWFWMVSDSSHKVKFKITRIHTYIVTMTRDLWLAGLYMPKIVPGCFAMVLVLGQIHWRWSRVPQVNLPG